jgi:hypothetical protein
MLEPNIQIVNWGGLITHYEKILDKYQTPPYNGTLTEAGREKDQKIVGEDRLSKKRGEGGMN